MLNHRLADWRQARDSMLELVAACAKCPFGLYEIRDSSVSHASHTYGFYEAYCTKYQGFPEGEARCRQYHEERARNTAANGIGVLTVCHAGVFNQTLPIIVGGDVKAVLAYGQMWVPADNQCEEAKRLHEQALTRLWPNDVSELRWLHTQIKRFSSEQLAELNHRLASLQQWLYSNL